MTKYHINEKGQPSRCTASVRDCPLGGDHFDSLHEAETAVAIHERITNSLFPTKNDLNNYTFKEKVYINELPEFEDTRLKDNIISLENYKPVEGRYDKTALLNDVGPRKEFNFSSESFLGKENPIKTFAEILQPIMLPDPVYTSPSGEEFGHTARNGDQVLDITEEDAEFLNEYFGNNIVDGDSMYSAFASEIHSDDDRLSFYVKDGVLYPEDYDALDNIKKNVGSSIPGLATWGISKGYNSEFMRWASQDPDAAQKIADSVTVEDKGRGVSYVINIGSIKYNW